MTTHHARHCAQVARVTQAIDTLVAECATEDLDPTLEGLAHYIQARWAMLDAERVMRGEEPYNTAYWDRLELVELAPRMTATTTTDCRDTAQNAPAGSSSSTLCSGLEPPGTGGTGSDACPTAARSAMVGTGSNGSR